MKPRPAAIEIQTPEQPAKYAAVTAIALALQRNADALLALAQAVDRGGVTVNITAREINAQESAISVK